MNPSDSKARGEPLRGNQRAHSPTGIYLALHGAKPGMMSAIANRLVDYFNVSDNALIQQRGVSTASYYIPGEPDAYERDWFYKDAVSLSATAHPICSPAVLGDRSGLPIRRFVREIRNGMDSATRVLSPVSYMHHNLHNDSIVAANDSLGVGKLYYYKSAGMSLVASGVITAALGLANLPDQCDAFWDAYYVTGGGLNDYTYVRGVRLAPPGSVITISDGGFKFRQEPGFAQFLLESQAEANDAVAPMDAAQRIVGTVAPYISEASRLRLSGGVDSRFAAATLIRSGKHFDATTYFPPNLEAEIAVQLHQRSPDSFGWQAIEANPSTVRQDGGEPQLPGPSSGSILERASDWFQYLGGDHWSTPIRSSPPIRRIVPAPLMVSGSHGDFTRAHYYGERDLDDGIAAPALRRYLSSFFRNRSILEPELRRRGAQLVKNEMLGALVEGIDGFHALDYSFFYNRVRRQFPPVSPSVVLPMLTPEMLRSTFWCSPREKVAGTAVRRMINEMVPEWKDVPYYHEVAAGLDPETTNKVSMQKTYWESDYKQFLEALETAIDATNYSGVSIDSALNEINELPEGKNRANQTFEFIFWHNAATEVLAGIRKVHRSHPGRV